MANSRVDPRWAKIFVINLPDAPERLARMRRVLGSLDLLFEVQEGIDGKTASSHPAFSRIPKMRLRYWAPAEIGCLLSHYACWLRIASGAEPFGLVLEDDVVLQPIVARILKHGSVIPADADIVKLETTSEPVDLDRRAKSRWQGIAFHKLRSIHYGSGAYLISRQSASLLAQRLDEFDMPVDDILWKPAANAFAHMRRYQIVPAVAIQVSVFRPLNPPSHLSSKIESQRQIVRSIARPHSAFQQMQSEDTARFRFIRLLRIFADRINTKRKIIPFGPETLSWHE